MSDGPLLNDVTRAFAEAHRNEDVRDLALKTKRACQVRHGRVVGRLSRRLRQRSQQTPGDFRNHE